jgi:hypothetical protein
MYFRLARELPMLPAKEEPMATRHLSLLSCALAWVLSSTPLVVAQEPQAQGKTLPIVDVQRRCGTSTP